MKNMTHTQLLEPILNLSQFLESKFNLDTFPEQAFKILDELKFEADFQDFEQAIADWMLELPKLPKQVNMYNVFGEPSISLFHNDKFAVDLYFWRTNDTLIHSHAFRGAFKVLYGRSLHEMFKVETEDNLARRHSEDVVSDVLSSKVIKSKSEILWPAETRLILPGMSLVHRVLHLDNPTVTLCIRTVNDTQLSQWHHLTSGISYQQKNIEDLTIKRILYFQFLYESNPFKAKDYLDHMLGLISVASQLALYEALFQDEFGLDHETTYFMIDHMRMRFQDLKWFDQYESHYKKMNQQLFEVQASSPELKLLAHGINQNYSHAEVSSQLKSLTKESIKSLCQRLLNDEAVFNEEHLEHQRQSIVDFSQR